MTGQEDLQELLRLLKARNKSMMNALKQANALQAKGLKSIAQIAEADLATVEQALGASEAKEAKKLQTACKDKLKKPAKRALDEASGGSGDAAKKPRIEIHRHDLDYSSMSGEQLEAALVLPLIEDEDAIRETVIETNRAPLVLAFAVELLRFTKPEQPPSSRLSLAQAVVSANSHSKAVSIGIEKPGKEEVLSEGQPKVTVLGRQIPVLKRSGYAWSGDAQSDSPAPASSTSASSSATVSNPQSSRNKWAASRRLSSKGSIFIAHAISTTSSAARAGLMKSLMEEKPHLEEATHNAWAIRTSFGNSPLKQEASFDDGESGCGNFILQLLRELDISNTLVVLTRYYGGVMLGPDRWRLMRECINDALSAQRRTASLADEPVWGLDMQDTRPATSTIGMPVHRPEAARNYLLRSFGPAASGTKTAKKTVAAANEERYENLGRLLGALRLLFASWANVLSRDELDRRAWSWYVAVRPDVEAGPAGWGSKGPLRLGKILDLRRKDTSQQT
ncbi:ribosomal protein S5 [Mariannaea sp. PMI_226]|nr:ribosomal protein S5 [Mariannaea sp. PMI_226]